MAAVGGAGILGGCGSSSPGKQTSDQGQHTSREGVESVIDALRTVPGVREARRGRDSEDLIVGTVGSERRVGTFFVTTSGAPVPHHLRRILAGTFEGRPLNNQYTIYWRNTEGLSYPQRRGRLQVEQDVEAALCRLATGRECSV